MFQKLPTAVKTDIGDRNSYEYREGNSRSAKVEMEEFSDLGNLIPSAREDRSVMDELDFALAGEFERKFNYSAENSSK